MHCLNVLSYAWVLFMQKEDIFLHSITFDIRHYQKLCKRHTYSKMFKVCVRNILIDTGNACVLVWHIICFYTLNRLGKTNCCSLEIYAPCPIKQFTEVTVSATVGDGIDRISEQSIEWVRKNIV